MSYDDSNVLKGTINILIDDNDPLNKIFKAIYPKTSADQVVDLDDTIIAKIKEIPITSVNNFGLVKIGNNITNNSGVISLTKDNVVDALGFEPLHKISQVEVSDKTLKLYVTQNIDGINFNGEDHVRHYCVCSTESSNAIKSVTINNFSLIEGATVTVKFLNKNTANALALNVNNTGVKLIKYHGEDVDPTYIAENSIYTLVYDGEFFQIVGDLDTNTSLVTGIKGSAESEYRKGNINISAENIGLGNVDNTRDDIKHVLSAKQLEEEVTIDGVSFNGSKNITHYGICSTSANEPVKSVSCEDFKLVKGSIITITFNQDNNANNILINVNNTGLKNAYYRNLPLDAEVIKKDRTYSFVYDGENYQLIGDLDANLITGVKGIAETTYRTGNISISASDVGLNKVSNTPDNEKKVAEAMKLSVPRSISLDNAAIGTTTFDGSANVVIDVTSLKADKLTGTAPINITGNATAASRLANARVFSIEDATGTNSGNAAVFNGENNVKLNLPSTIKANLVGNASTATTLQHVRKINVSDASGVNIGETVNFDGSSNITLTLPNTINANINGNVSGRINEAVSAVNDGDGNPINTTYAKLNSPSFYGTVTAPTPAIGSNDNQVATTEFVNNSAASLQYCRCSTSGDVKFKTVSCEGFILKKGAGIIITFDNTNTVLSPTLNVNDTYNIPIQYRGNSILYSALQANRTYHFVYDGNYYQLIGDLDTNLITGVKGIAETTYRTGNVSISAENVGLGKVNNTADTEKKVAEATKATQDGLGNVITSTYLGKDEKAIDAVKADQAEKAVKDINGYNFIDTYAKLNSPIFTGNPQVPTAIPNSNNLQAVNTAYVYNEVSQLKNADSAIISRMDNTDSLINQRLGEINNKIDGKQDINAALNSIGSLNASAGKILYTVDKDEYALADLTDFARSILDDANAVTIRNTIDALGKSEKAVDSQKADLAIKAITDDQGNTFTSFYAEKNSPTFTGIPKVPTADGTNVEQIVNVEYIDNKVNNINNETANIRRLIQEVSSDINNINETLSNKIDEKQNINEVLSGLSQLNTGINKVIYTSSKNVYETTSLTEFARSILDDEDAATVRNTIGALGRNETAIKAINDENGNSIKDTYAPINSPNFIGNPQVPTPASGSNDLRIANTAYVKGEIDKLIDSDSDLIDTINSLKESLEGEQGNIVEILNSKQNKNAILTNISELTTSSEQIPYTNTSNKFEMTDLTKFARSILDDENAVTVRNTIDALGKTETAINANKLGNIEASKYALTDSPSFTGTVTAPTLAKGTDNDKIATTAFVNNANIHYCRCANNEDIINKTAECTGFILKNGVEVIVKFVNNNAANNPTLNINGTGAKSIQYHGTNIPIDAIQGGRFYHFVYDGSYYQLVGDINTNLITGVKGNSEPSYRTGNINITKANIGLDKVNNTSDAEKRVLSAESATMDSAGNIIVSTYLNKNGKAVDSAKADQAGRSEKDINGSIIHTTYAKLDSPIFTGAPKVPNISNDADPKQIANINYVNGEVYKLNLKDQQLLEAINNVQANLDTKELDLESKINVKQNQSVSLANIAGLNTSANKMLYTTSKDNYELTDLTEFARSILDDEDALTVRTTIGALGKNEKAVNSINADLAAKATADANGNIISTTYASIKDPIFTGVPQAPNPPAGTANTQIATTAFVQAGIDQLTAANTEIVNQLASLAQIITNDSEGLNDNLLNKQPLSEALSSIAGLDTAADRMIYTTSPNTYTTTPLTEFARYILDDTDAIAVRNTINALGKNETAINANKLGDIEANKYALINSPKFTGVPEAPTAAPGTSTKQIATTEFVNNAIGNGNTDEKVEQRKASINATYPVLIAAVADANNNINATNVQFASGVKINPSTSSISAINFVGDLTGNANTATKAEKDSVGNVINTTYAKIDSPEFTGIPIVPTANKGNNSRQIATTAFVNNANIKYTVCNTAEDVKEKIVDCEGFILRAGAEIIVTFTNNNTVNYPTLNINDTGNIYMQYKQTNMLQNMLQANKTYHFIYDGENYQLIGDLDTNLITGVKGTAEGTYRTGNVSINASNIGLDKVNNTADTEKKVAEAIKSTQDSAGNVIVTTYLKKDEKAVDSYSADHANIAEKDINGNNFVDVYAKLNSPKFTGMPEVPTAVVGTNTQQVASTAFVQNEIDLLKDADTNIISMVNITDKNVDNINKTLKSKIDTKQDKHASLTNIAALNTTANKMLYTTSENAYATATLTPFARTILDDADATAVRTTIGALGKTEKAVNAVKADQAIMAENDTRGNNIINTYAPLNNPILTGIPKTTTPNGADLQQIANVDFVKNEVTKLSTEDNNIKDSINTLRQSLNSKSTELDSKINLKQQSSVALTSISELETSADKMLYTTSADEYQLTTLTPFARQILDDLNDTAVRTTIKALGKEEVALRAAADEYGENLADNYAKLNSPKFTGTPEVPTAISGSNSLQIANTAYVKNEINKLIDSDSDLIDTINSLKESLEGEQGNIIDVLNSKQDKNAALTSISELSTSSNQLLYTTATNRFETTPITSFVRQILDDENAVTVRNTIDALGKTETAANTDKLGNIEASKYALTDSPEFTGEVLAPTLVKGTNNKQIATTAFVNNSLIHYCLCNSGESIVSKIAECNGYILREGSEIIVRFTYNNVVESPTLNINGTGAKPIQYCGANIPVDAIQAGRFYHFVYDGTNYQLLGDINTNIITGVKGNNEFTYRTGNVNITKTDIGLSNVDNTADFNKNVAYAEKANTDNLGNIIHTTYLGKSEKAVDSYLADQATLALNAENDINGNKINTTYAPLNSPNLIGIPTTPTATNTTNKKQITNIEFVSNEIDKVNTTITTLNRTVNTIKTDLEEKDEELDNKIKSKQDKHAALTSISELATGPDKMIYTTGQNTYETSNLTEFARSILASRDADTIRSLLNALGKSEKAVDSQKADSASKATSDANGNIISTTYAPINNPVFSGIPQAPNPAAGTANTQIATTAFVQAGIDKLTAANLDVLNQLSEIKIAAGTDTSAILEGLKTKQDKNDALTSISGLNISPNQILYGVGVNTYDTTAFTGLAKSLISKETALEMRTTIDALGKNERAVDSVSLGGVTADKYAKIDSPKFTGIPEASTATLNTNNNQLATTEFAHNAAQAANTDYRVEQKKTATNATYPILMVPVADANSNISPSTIQFSSGVKINPFANSISATNFIGDLTGNADTSTRAENDSNGNKINTTYAPLYSPNLTGIPNAPTADKGENSQQIATTAFVNNANIKYAVCNTAEDIQEKVVDCEGFILRTGAEIIITFTNDNTVSGPTLNVNNTGSINIYYRQSNIPLTSIKADRTYHFIYDGINYQLVGDLDTNLITGVKGIAETTYRTGNVSISASDVGLDKVNNTADSDKKVAEAIKATCDASGNVIVDTYLTKNEQAASALIADRAVLADSDAYGNSIHTTYAKLNSPNLTGTPTAPTANGGTSTQQIATTAFVINEISQLEEITNNLSSNVNTIKTNLERKDIELQNNINGKQDINAALTSISQINTSANKILYTTAKDSYEATTLTEYMRSLLASVSAEAARNTLNALGKSEQAVDSAKADRAYSDYDGNPIAYTYAKAKDSVLTGKPTAPTAAVGTNTTQIATTAFVNNTLNEAVGADSDLINSISEIRSMLQGDGSIATQLANKQNKSDVLTHISDLSSESNKIFYTAASNIISTTDLTDFARSIINKSSAAAVRNAIDALGKNEKAATALIADQAEYDISGNSITSTYAPINGPVFTGIPKVPTPNLGDKSLQIANTQFVSNEITKINSSNNELSGKVNDLQEDLNAKYEELDNKINTKQNQHLALNSISTLNAPAGKMLYTTSANVYATATFTELAQHILDDETEEEVRITIGALGKNEKAVDSQKADSALRATADANGNIISTTYAPINTPIFTGIPQAPNPPAGTANTQIATTAFVQAGIDKLTAANADLVQQLRDFQFNSGADTSAIFAELNGKQDKCEILDNFVSLETEADMLVYASLPNAWSQTPLTDFARQILDDANAASVRTTIGALSSGDTIARATADASGNTITSTYAPLASPNLTGRPTAPTADVGTNDAQIATTAFAMTAAANANTDERVAQDKSTSNNTYPILASGTANANNNISAGHAIFGSGVKLNPSTSAITATTFIGALSGTATNSLQLGGTLAANYAKLDSPGLTGTPTAPTAAVGTDTTQVATTAFVQAAIKKLVGTAPATLDTLAEIAAAINNDASVYNTLDAAITNKQPLHAALTSISGLSTDANKMIYTTAANTYKTTTLTDFARQILDDANAASVRTTIGALSSGDTIARATADASGNTITSTYAPLASPNLTGTPKAPTATVGTNTTQIATTEFAMTAAANANTHYVTKLIVGGATATANGSTTNGNTFIRLFDDSTHRNNIKIIGSGATTVTSDANGIITISSTDTDTNTDTLVSQSISSANSTYPLLMTPTANATVNQGAKTTIFGSGIKANPSTSAITATTFIGALSGTAARATADASGNTISSTYAKLNSPALTGTPTAPTADSGTNTTQIATTAFVQTGLSGKQDKRAVLTSIVGLNTDVYENVTVNNNGTSTTESQFVNQYIYTTAKNTYTTGHISSLAREAIACREAEDFRTVIGALGKSEKAASAGTADSATKATKDGQGNTIFDYYARVASPLFTGDPKLKDSDGNNYSLVSTKYVQSELSPIRTNISTAQTDINSIKTTLGSLSAGTTNLIDTVNGKQDHYAALDSIGKLNPAANKFLYTTQQNTFTIANITSTGISILGSSSAAAARTTIGAISSGDTINNANKLGNVSASNYMPKAYTRTIDIKVSDWIASTEDDEYYADIVDTNITGTDIVDVCIVRISQMVANTANLIPTNESYNGYVRIFAQTKPEDYIRVQYSILKTV